jgi:nucleoside-diphosphate-sugar epimerase
MTDRRISTVAVTGGSGKLGRAVVRDLVEHGYTVVTLDRVPPPAGADNPYVRVDLTDYGQVFEALHAIDDRHTGVDAVVHLGAIPAPGMVPNAALFTNNVTSTYNVFAAAKACGIKRVVWASSETVLGLPFDTPPPYIPVDEEYPPRPESSYSLSKRVEESMAEQFCRWDPELTMIGLRFSNVMDPPDYAAFPSFDVDARSRKWNLWGYIDARDGAQAVRKALTADLTGREIFIIAAADTVMTRPNAELVAEVFPGSEITGEVGANETLLGIGKARRLLGFDPQHSWRDEV